MYNPPTFISSFRDGLGLAMGLSDEYAFANAAVLLDRRRRVLLVHRSDRVGGSIGRLVDQICARTCGSLSSAGTPASVLLITVRPVEADVVREADLHLFRRARWTLGAAGPDLLDWIETDGDLFRSYAYLTCPGLAWPNDPPGDRLDAFSGP